MQRTEYIIDVNQGPSLIRTDLGVRRLDSTRTLEFKFEAYNTTNTFAPGLPNTNVLSSLFGRSTSQDQENRGREMQYSLRLHF